MQPQRVEILGVPVDVVDMARAVDVVDTMVRGDSPQAIIAVNPEKVIKAQNDAVLLGCLRAAGLLIPDGMGIVIGCRLLGIARMQRVPGAELMPELCALAERKGYSVFLYGAAPEVNERAVAVLRERYPRLYIAGSQHGHVSEEEQEAVVAKINASGAQFLFVALGSPRQELWMEKYLPHLCVKVSQGVGGTFDVIAGRVRRAPALWRRLNLEWLYRLLSQPRRLVRQTALPRFAYQVMRRWALRER